MIRDNLRAFHTVGERTPDAMSLRSASRTALEDRPPHRPDGAPAHPGPAGAASPGLADPSARTAPARVLPARAGRAAPPLRNPSNDVYRRFRP
ncbi:hypothetical protein GCM10012287_55370 [Streptomyces daqingensis]|uniref:Uncharacterized protein n=1 Tax=Streptomyces daqingensis TaxID=1472640 RepID=A0ABQ2MUC8_9ACTN|nr:hypothetical protein GCM10012287_55370 [Streptomyces daqingensis]